MNFPPASSCSSTTSTLAGQGFPSTIKFRPLCVTCPGNDVLAAFGSEGGSSLPRGLRPDGLAATLLRSGFRLYLFAVTMRCVGGKPGRAYVRTP